MRKPVDDPTDPLAGASNRPTGTSLAARRAEGRKMPLFNASGGPRVLWLAVFLCTLIAGSSFACSPGEVIDQPGARDRERLLFAFADEHLAAKDLADAVPRGFQFLDVSRHGYERHREEWITVGVRMKGGVPVSRAIFYVHPDATAAEAMYERQSKLVNADGQAGLDDPQARPFTDGALEVRNWCGARPDELFWCHAFRGRVYLVVQSSAGWPDGRDVSPRERRAAKRLAAAFGTYLQRHVPESS